MEDLLIKPHDPASFAVLVGHLYLIARQSQVGEESKNIPLELPGSSAGMREVGLRCSGVVFED